MKKLNASTDSSNPTKLYHKIENWALILLIYTLLVILWGAWVRISHSGDGCGDTWPLCQGKLIPDAEQKKTWVEYGHRFTSGIYGIFVIALFFWIRKNIKKINSEINKWSFWTLFFMITEALLGAKLVLFKLVNLNDSIWRLIVMTFHQFNSFLLVAMTVRLWAEARGQRAYSQEPCLIQEENLTNSFNSENKFKKYFPLTLILIAVTGAWAALASTLFPSTSLLQGLVDDFAADSHYLLKLRIVHPLLGVTIGLSLSYFYFLKNNLRYAICLFFAVIFGIITLLLLSPVWMKLSHLFLAHFIWSMLIFDYHLQSIQKRLEI